MASKRQLKKQIELVCGDIAGECLVVRDLVPGFDYDNMTAIIVEVAQLQYATLRRVGFNFDKSRRDFANGKEYKKATRAYHKAAYKKLADDFKASVNEIVKKMNNEMPKAVKDANKEA